MFSKNEASDLSAAGKKALLDFAMDVKAAKRKG
jgi:hypothetical protein